MRSILNNDDNPSFAVRKHVDIPPRPSPSYENSGHPEFGTGWPSQFPQTHQRHSPVVATAPPIHTMDIQIRQHQHQQQQPYHTESSFSPLPALHSREPSFGSNDGRASPASTTDLGRKPKKNKYACPYAVSHSCTATFTTSGHAARHGKKHTGEKSVHCPICNKAFTRKDNMKQHRRIHKTSVKEPSSPSSKWPNNNSDHERRENSQAESDGESTSAVSSPAQSY